jgi:hypothetical protein
MTLLCEVLLKRDIACLKPPDLFFNPDLDLGSEDDHILTSRRVMPIMEITGWPPDEPNTCGYCNAVHSRTPA